MFDFENINKLLSAFAVYQSFLFALILFFYKGKYVISKRLLCFYMIIQTAFFFGIYLYYKNATELLHYAYYFYQPVILLIIPSFYIYLKVLTTKRLTFTYHSLVHFFPAIFIFILNLFTYQILPANAKQKVIFGITDPLGVNVLQNYVCYAYYFGVALLFLQVAIYSVRVFRNLLRYRQSIANQFSYTEDVNGNWLIGYTIALVVFIITIEPAKQYAISENEFIKIGFNVWMLALNAFLGINGINQPEIYKHKAKYVESVDDFDKAEISVQKNIGESKAQPASEETTTAEVKPKTSITNKEPNKNIKTEDIETAIKEKIPVSNYENGKYQKSTLSEDFKLELKNKLLQCIDNEKPYLNQNLRIDDLAAMINTNKTYLSQLINEEFNESFYYFVNRYRVDEAKEMLISGDFNHLSIQGIAENAGFKSISSFNTSFKKYVGATPTQYRKNIGNEKSDITEK